MAHLWTYILQVNIYYYSCHIKHRDIKISTFCILLKLYTIESYVKIPWNFRFKTPLRGVSNNRFNLSKYF